MDETQGDLPFVNFCWFNYGLWWLFLVDLDFLFFSFFDSTGV
jgi:hypothetical protein